MAFWDKITSRGNVDDRRSVVGASGMGIAGILLLMGVTYLMGGNPLDVLVQQDLSALQQNVTEKNTTQYEGIDSYELFISQVLGSANDMWATTFSNLGREYRPTTVVLFRKYTESNCGGADVVIGPHYCGIDEKIYLDETFFAALQSRFGATGGDVAEAYVIAHEVGHHVQHQLDILSTESVTNEQSIAVELQADCFAGLWAHSIKNLGVLEFGEINEALDAAAAVGDDRIQERVRGEIQLESWTHGSSAQRVTAFNEGYISGSLDACLQYTERNI